MTTSVKLILYVSFLALSYVLTTILVMMGTWYYWNREHEKASKCLALCLMLRLAAQGREAL